MGLWSQPVVPSRCSLFLAVAVFEAQSKEGESAHLLRHLQLQLRSRQQSQVRFRLQCASQGQQQAKPQVSYGYHAVAVSSRRQPPGTSAAMHGTMESASST